MGIVRWLVCGFSLAACSARALSGGDETLPASSWGGDQAIVNVIASGASIEFECAGGTISVPFKIDSRGGFDLPGTFAPQSHGPTRDGDVATAKVRYVGRVQGDTMTLTVMQASESLGPYTLTRDRRPALKKCG